MSILKKLITFTKKVGFRTAKVFGYTPREKPVEYIAPHIPKDLQVAKRARKAQQAKAALSRLKSAERAAASAVRHEAHARRALKRYHRKIAEKEEYGLGLTYTARMKRRRLTRANFAAIERASLKKRTLKKSIRDYTGLLKRTEYKRREWDRKWSKTAAKIKKDIAQRERLSEQFYNAKKTLSEKKYGQGWYLFYEIELCNKSPPCEPDAPETYWELRTEKISGQAFEYTMGKEHLERSLEEITSRTGFLWRTRKERIIYIKGAGGVEQ